VERRRSDGLIVTNLAQRGYPWARDIAASLRDALLSGDDDAVAEVQRRVQARLIERPETPRR
jgi:hypothetical protein